MILAAGLGTRLKPWTDKHPKALAPVHGKPLLQWNIEYLAAAGIEEFVVNTHHFAQQIEAAITENKGWGKKIHISYEEEVLETGGGLVNARHYFQEGSFVVMNVDILTKMNIRKMMNFHLLHQPLVTLAVSKRESSRSFLFNKEGLLAGWKNFKTGEERISRQEEEYLPLAFSGIHIINAGIFQHSTFSGKFSLVDWYLQLAATHQLLAYDHTGERVLDVGKPESMIEAELFFKKN